MSKIEKEQGNLWNMKLNILVDALKNILCLDSEDSIVQNELDNSNEESEPEHTLFMKAFNDEQMVSYDPLYINEGMVDAHGDGISDKELDNLVAKINEKIADGTMIAKVHHMLPTTEWSYVKASRMPMPVVIENPLAEGGKIHIPEGQPILKTQFHTERAWEAKKAGKIKNPSIGGKGYRVPNPDYQESE